MSKSNDYTEPSSQMTRVELGRFVELFERNTKTQGLTRCLPIRKHEKGKMQGLTRCPPIRMLIFDLNRKSDRQIYASTGTSRPFVRPSRPFDGTSRPFAGTSRPYTGKSRPFAGTSRPDPSGFHPPPKKKGCGNRTAENLATISLPNER